MAKRNKNYYVSKNKKTTTPSFTKVAPRRVQSSSFKKIRFYSIMLLLVVAFGFLISGFISATAKNTAFAECLADSEAKMFGASWCAACSQQKNILGNVRAIPYVECAIPGSPNAQLPECDAANITSYPTWVFNSGETVVQGVLSRQELSEITGCVR